jgi:hypothetical protein
MFFLLFLHDDRRIRIHTSDNWIWIREAQKQVDAVDPNSDSDLQHWYKDDILLSDLASALEEECVVLEPGVGCLQRSQHARHRHARGSLRMRRIAFIFIFGSATGRSARF